MTEFDLAAEIEKCNPLQVRWVIARLSTRTDANAADQIGVARETVARWKHGIDLDAIIATLLRDMVRAAILTLQSATQEAAACAIELMRTSVSETVKLGAVREILDRGGVPSTLNTEQNGELIIRVRRDDD